MNFLSLLSPLVYLDSIYKMHSPIMKYLEDTVTSTSAITVLPFSGIAKYGISPDIITGATRKSTLSPVIYQTKMDFHRWCIQKNLTFNITKNDTVGDYITMLPIQHRDYGNHHALPVFM